MAKSGLRQELDIALQPKQDELLGLMRQVGPTVPTRIGWGGSRGAAKSGGLRRVCLAMRFLYPGTAGCIVRKIWEDLRINHVEPYFLEWPWLEQFYNVSEHEIVIPMKKGPPSVIAFRYAEGLKKVRQKFMGPEYHEIYVDQSEQFSEEELITMPTAARMPGSTEGECKTAYFFNPGGPGTEYLRRVFYLRQYNKRERPGNFSFIQAYGWDNYEWFRESGVKLDVDRFYQLPAGDPAKPPEEQPGTRLQMFVTSTQAGKDLDALPPSLRAGHLLGSFDRFAGQYFSAVWDEDKCVESQSRMELLLQPWWKRWLATDWGFSHYMPTLWAAIGKLSPQQFEQFFGIRTEWPIDVVCVYRELVVNETAEADVAKLICDGGELKDGGMFHGTPVEEREVMTRHFFSVEKIKDEKDQARDHSRRELMGPTLKRAGMPTLEPADNARVDGWRLLYALLKQTCSLRSVDPKTGIITKEMAQRGPMVLMGANCVHVMASIPLAIRSEKDPEDVEKSPTLADDVLDCLRYLMKSYLRPKVKAPREVRAAMVIQSNPEPTQRAMAMLRFNSEEKKHRRRKGRWTTG